MPLTSAFLSVLLLAPLAQPTTYQVGDEVTGAHSTSFKIGRKQTHRVAAGTSFRISAIQGRWLWAGGAKAGWIDQKHVVAQSRAPEYFAAARWRSPHNAELLAAEKLAQEASRGKTSPLDLDRVVRSFEAMLQEDAAAESITNVFALRKAEPDFMEFVDLKVPTPEEERFGTWRTFMQGKNCAGIQKYRCSITTFRCTTESPFEATCGRFNYRSRLDFRQFDPFPSARFARLSTETTWSAKLLADQAAFQMNGATPETQLTDAFSLAFHFPQPVGAAGGDASTTWESLSRDDHSRSAAEPKLFDETSISALATAAW